MDFFVILVAAFIISFFGKSNSGSNSKENGLSDIEKFDMFNKFNKK